MGDILKFKISADLKNIIGQELITDDHIAIFELVKNSHDANATKVDIVFENIKNSTNGASKIWIIDNGCGMSKEDIRDKWLFVGYSEKKDISNNNYRSKIKKPNRLMAGHKGIGRFSVDRLGKILRLYSQKQNDNDIHVLEMDWGKFENKPLQEFTTINVNYEKIKNKPFENILKNTYKHGTILEIQNLRDEWDKDKIMKLKRYLQKLINPSENTNYEFQINIIADAFLEDDKSCEEHNKINGPIINFVFEKLKIKTTEIICRINAKEIHTELIDKGKSIFKMIEKNNCEKIIDVSIRLFYLNTQAKTTFTKTMGLPPVRYGSVLLYKHGFRIHPYGDEGDDWLELEKRRAQGYKRFISAREIMGRVEIHENQKGFQEVSSRAGGVIKTNEYDQLRKVVLNILKILENYVVKGINWDTDDQEKMHTKDQINEYSIKLISQLLKKPEEKNPTIIVNDELLHILENKQKNQLPDLVKQLSKIVTHLPNSEEKIDLTNKLKMSKLSVDEYLKNKSRLKTVEKDLVFFKKELENKDQLVNIYHAIGLASLHIELKIIDINEEFKFMKECSKIYPMIDYISVENQKIKSLREVAVFAQFDMRGESIVDDLAAYIKEYVQTVFKRRKNKIKAKFLNEIQFIIKFSPLGVSTILDNFISNSQKANARTMTFNFQRDAASMTVLIGDDGNKVVDIVKDTMFNRGVSATDGTGIGLHHVKTLLNASSNQVEFVGNDIPSMGSGACFKVIYNDRK